MMFSNQVSGMEENTLKNNLELSLLNLDIKLIGVKCQ